MYGKNYWGTQRATFVLDENAHARRQVLGEDHL